MSVSEATYRQIALEDPGGKWELDCGRLRQKPAMTYTHNSVLLDLYDELRRQLDPSQFRPRANLGHVKRSTQSYYIPDVYVVPADILRQHYGDRDLEVWEMPLPLVVEVWSPSTGDYDVDAKLPEYQRRGDLEIWRIHPYDHTLTALVRQPDGTYTMTEHRGGVVTPNALLGVTIDLDALFTPK